MITKTEITAATLAAALALLAGPAAAQMMQGEKTMGDKEKCYGIALKGQNGGLLASLWHLTRDG